MDISKTKQEQSAGENSSQNQLVGDNSSQTIIETQVNSVNNTSITYNGMSPTEIVEFTTTVSAQVTKQALALCTEVAEETAKHRINDFETIWVQRITKMENVVNNLIDPKFQFMIRDAQITAVKSTRKDDLDMLSELLAYHIEKGSSNMKIDAGIRRAIEIVHEVDNDSLCALTIVASLLGIMPLNGDIKIGLSNLNDVFSHLLYTDLPEGYDWIDHLNVLGTVTVLTGNFYKLSRIISNSYNGYVCAGIKENSEEHNQAIEILNNHGYDSRVLVSNDCLPGYLRLPIVTQGSLKEELKPILNLYSKDKEIVKSSELNFMALWDSHDSLRIIREWFERIPVWFRINSVGNALAQTNAKRCFPGFPDLI